MASNLVIVESPAKAKTIENYLGKDFIVKSSFGNIRNLPKKGMGVVWPAAWMFQHRGNPVHTHSKYIATGWYWYPEETGYYGNTKSS